MKLKVGETTEVGLCVYKRLSKAQALKLVKENPQQTFVEMESGGLVRSLAHSEIKNTACMVLIRVASKD